jgi:hypothetical protein
LLGIFAIAGRNYIRLVRNQVKAIPRPFQPFEQEIGKRRNKCRPVTHIRSYLPQFDVPLPFPPTSIDLKQLSKIRQFFIISLSRGTDVPTMATLAFMKVARQQGHDVVLFRWNEALTLARPDIGD